MSDKRRPTETDRRCTDTGPGRWVRERETNPAVDGSLVADGGHEISECIELLANDRRRYVLYYLRGERRANFEEITEQVAAWEIDTSPEELDEQTKRNVQIDLHHAHLPKLEDAGLIWYDRLHGAIRFHCVPEPVDTFLDYCSTNEACDVD